MQYNMGEMSRGYLINMKCRSTYLTYLYLNKATPSHTLISGQSTLSQEDARGRVI